MQTEIILGLFGVLVVVLTWAAVRVFLRKKKREQTEAIPKPPPPQAQAVKAALSEAQARLAERHDLDQEQVSQALEAEDPLSALEALGRARDRGKD